MCQSNWMIARGRQLASSCCRCTFFPLLSQPDVLPALPAAAAVPPAAAGRLEEQKGVDILLAALKQLPAGSPVQVVVLGTGKAALEAQVKVLATLYPGMAAGVVQFSNPMAHAITAGADYMLVPSRFEPCGLIQLHAMQYGTVPLVASTGGLVDTVKEGVTGFQMGALDPDDLLEEDAGGCGVWVWWVGGGWLVGGWGGVEEALGAGLRLMVSQTHVHSLPPSLPPPPAPPCCSGRRGHDPARRRGLRHPAVHRHARPLHLARPVLGPGAVRCGGSWRWWWRRLMAVGGGCVGRVSGGSQRSRRWTTPPAPQPPSPSPYSPASAICCPVPAACLPALPAARQEVGGGADRDEVWPGAHPRGHRRQGRGHDAQAEARPRRCPGLNIRTHTPPLCTTATESDGAMRWRGACAAPLRSTPQ